VALEPDTPSKTLDRGCHRRRPRALLQGGLGAGNN
jgi:hypothetical protein